MPSRSPECRAVVGEFGKRVQTIITCVQVLTMNSTKLGKCSLIEGISKEAAAIMMKKLKGPISFQKKI